MIFQNIYFARTCKRALVLLIVFTASLLLLSCSDESQPQPQNPTPNPGNNSGALPPGPATVEKISPPGGIPGIEVVITGTNFSTILSNNSVNFNGDYGQIVSASPTELVVVVPTGGTTGSIVVGALGRKVVGPLFTYLEILTIVQEQHPDGAKMKVWRNNRFSKMLHTQLDFFGQRCSFRWR